MCLFFCYFHLAIACSYFPHPVFFFMYEQNKKNTRIQNKSLLKKCKNIKKAEWKWSDEQWKTKCLIILAVSVFRYQVRQQKETYMTYMKCNTWYLVDLSWIIPPTWLQSGPLGHHIQGWHLFKTFDWHETKYCKHRKDLNGTLRMYAVKSFL